MTYKIPNAQILNGISQKKFQLSRPVHVIFKSDKLDYLRCPRKEIFFDNFFSIEQGPSNVGKLNWDLLGFFHSYLVSPWVSCNTFYLHLPWEFKNQSQCCKYQVFVILHPTFLAMKYQGTITVQTVKPVVVLAQWTIKKVIYGSLAKVLRPLKEDKGNPKGKRDEARSLFTLGGSRIEFERLIPINP